MTCPNCGERIARGRRFFLMGALALPAAAALARVVPKLPYEAPKLTKIGRIVINGQEWTYESSIFFAVAT